MINGDILTDLDPNKLHNGNYAALALVPLISPYGIVELDQKSNILGFAEKPPIKDRWINAGVYYFTREVFTLPATKWQYRSYRTSYNGKGKEIESGKI